MTNIIPSSCSILKKIIGNILTFFYVNRLRLFVYVISFFAISTFILAVINGRKSNLDSVLDLVVSTSSIITAIIITYLFNKLFAEKTIRIERKKEIDELSLKINLLRYLSYKIIHQIDFWEIPKKGHISNIIKNKYSWLTYEVYRGEDNNHKIPYDKFEEIDREIHSTFGQTFLAFKGLIDGEDKFYEYPEVNPKNYSLDQTSKYIEYTASIWSFMDKNPNFLDISSIHTYWQKSFGNIYLKLFNKKLNITKSHIKFKELFSYFYENILVKHNYLTQLNTISPYKTFLSLFSNLVIFIFITLGALIIKILGVVDCQLLIIYIVTLFISNTLDLIILTGMSIRKELEIKEIFKV
ncbi:hypothetical protein [Sphingobacterium hungaricum]